MLKPDVGPVYNKSVKVLDLSYNNFNNRILSSEISEVLEVNR